MWIIFTCQGFRWNSIFLVASTVYLLSGTAVLCYCSISENHCVCIYIYTHTHTRTHNMCIYIYIYYTYYTYTYYMYIYSCCWRQKKVSLVPISLSWWELIAHVWFLWLQMFILCMDFYKWRASYLKAIHADHCVLCPFVSRFWISKSLCCHLGTPCLIIEILWIHI